MILHLLGFEIKINRRALIWVCLFLFVFQIFFTAFYSNIRPDETLTDLFERLPKVLRSLMGDGNVSLLSLNGFISFGFTHPIVMLLVFSLSVFFTSRHAVNCGGVGLSDMIHSQPVSRTFSLLLRVAACEVAGFLAVLSLYAGHFLSIHIFVLPAEPSKLCFLYAAINLYALFLAVAGLGLFIGVCSRRRVTAVGATTGILAAMFIINIFAEFWSLFKYPKLISFLTYYSPSKIVMGQAFPWTNIIILISFYLVFIGASLILFNRRDL